MRLLQGQNFVQEKENPIDALPNPGQSGASSIPSDGLPGKAAPAFTRGDGSDGVTGFSPLLRDGSLQEPAENTAAECPCSGRKVTIGERKMKRLE
jgi:hypothetical protein